MDKREIGIWGEDAACRYIQGLGLKVLARNYHSRYGEIDIVAQDGEYLVFVEVKTRKNARFGMPGEYVDLRKQEKLIKTALDYLGGNDQAARFDVAEVFYRLCGGNLVLERVNYIENAFEAQV